MARKTRSRDARSTASKHGRRSGRSASGAAPKPSNRLLSDVASERIRNDILECALAPGLELTETEFRERYGLTIATTRAALARLTQEGLVRSEPRRGYVISEITLRDVMEIFDLRLMLEPEVARRATHCLTPSDVKNLYDICDHGLAEAVIRSRDKWLANNRDFHLAVARICGNSRILATVQHLIDEGQRVLYLALKQLDYSERFVEEHRELVALMAAGKSDAAAEAAYKQIADGKAWVLAGLLSSSELMDKNISQIS